MGMQHLTTGKLLGKSFLSKMPWQTVRVLFLSALNPTATRHIGCCIAREADAMLPQMLPFTKTDGNKWIRLGCSTIFLGLCTKQGEANAILTRGFALPTSAGAYQGLDLEVFFDLRSYCRARRGEAPSRRVKVSDSHS